jgi:hypothetical protein
VALQPYEPLSATISPHLVSSPPPFIAQSAI